MKLYHLRILLPIAVLLVVIVTACSPPQATQAMIAVIVTADDQELDIVISPGNTVQDVLDSTGVMLGPLDQVEPPAYTLLSDGAEITIKRITEEFSVEQEVIPFERQILHTESLPDKEQLLVQSGLNGVREITYRHVSQDGVPVSKDPVKSVVITETIPEIVMVGVQSSFAPIVIPGRLAYIMGGNAWIIEENTANRQPVVTTGDLDGHVFSLSEDGSSLLFTRKSEDEDNINSLWVANIQEDNPELYDLEISNVIHFADWAPGSTTRIAFSTVEPRATAPGWQANNDLNMVTISKSGWVSDWEVVIEPNSGGLYGWWGTTFTWDPTGERMGYARPDSIGLVNLEEGEFTPLLEIIPFQTNADWAWVPGLAWSPDGKAIYSIRHLSTTETQNPEESPSFHLVALQLEDGGIIDVVPLTGMFAYPKASPESQRSSGESAHDIAFLQAIFPLQSDSSRYRLVVMDRDASNRNVVFPEEGEPGLDPQEVVWSPVPFNDTDTYKLAITHLGNIWLVDPSHQEEPLQVTGEGLVNRMDWVAPVE